ncbi:MAG: tRNA (adenosine(37)-N6)-threonylcarbamoyltransferase complex dimerization subunit type 1 TsaB [Aestuariibacter sp.]
MNDKKILVIDTATEACSVAFSLNGTVTSKFAVCPQEHSKRLLPMVDELLKDAKVTINDIDILGVGIGPGSFTGVRIAMGMAQGLAFGAKIPVVGASTLQAMAQETYHRTGVGQVYSAIDARMSEVYFAGFDVDDAGLMCEREVQQVLPPQQVASEYLGSGREFGFAGTGWQAYSELQNSVSGAPLVQYPSAEFMLPFVIAQLEQQKAIDIMDLEPVYLRDKVTWKKLPGRE